MWGKMIFKGAYRFSKQQHKANEHFQLDDSNAQLETTHTHTDKYAHRYTTTIQTWHYGILADVPLYESSAKNVYLTSNSNFLE